MCVSAEQATAALLLRMAASRPATSVKHSLVAAERSLGGLPCRPPAVAWSASRQQLPPGACTAALGPPRTAAGNHSSLGGAASYSTSSNGNGSSNGNSNGSAPAALQAAAAAPFSTAADAARQHQQQPLQQQQAAGLFQQAALPSRSVGPPKRRSTKDLPPTKGLALLQRAREQYNGDVPRGQGQQALRAVEPGNGNGNGHGNGNGNGNGNGAHHLQAHHQQQHVPSQPQWVVVQQQQQQQWPHTNGFGGHQPAMQQQPQSQQQLIQPLQSSQQQQPPLPSPPQPPPPQPQASWQPQPTQPPHTHQQQQQQQLPPQPQTSWQPPAMQQQQQQGAHYVITNGHMPPPQPAVSSSSSSSSSATTAVQVDAAAAAAAADGEAPLDFSTVVSGPGDTLWAEPADPVTQLPPDVCVVDSPAAAKAVVDQLMHMAQHGCTFTGPDGSTHTIPAHEVVFACDTEVAGIDVKSQSPVGHGTVICFSIYAGPWADFAAAGCSSSSSAVVAATSAAAATADAGGAAAVGVLQQLQQQRPRASRIWVDLTGGWYEKRRAQLQEEAAQRAAEEAASAAAAVAAPAPAPAPVAAPAAAKAAKAAVPVAGTPVSGIRVEGRPYTAEEFERKRWKKAQLQATADELGVAYSQEDTNAALLNAILQHHQQQQQPAPLQQQQQQQQQQQRQQQESQPELFTEERLKQFRKKAELREIADKLGVHYRQKDTLADLRDAILQHQQQQLQSQPQQQPEPVQATGQQQQEQQLQSQQQEQRQQQLSWGAQLLLQDQAVLQEEQLLQAGTDPDPLGTPAAGLEPLPEAAAEAAEAAPSRRRTRRGSVHHAASTHSSSATADHGVSSIGGSGSSGSSGPVVAVAQVAVDPASSSSFLGGSVDDSSTSSTSSFLSDASSSSSSSSIRRRSSTGCGSTASSGWTPPRPGGLAVSGVLGGGLGPPTVAELRSDPTAAGILAEFERFFCSEVPQKVWHNYGFDRHVLEGLLPRDAVSGQAKKLAGFGGDTLHMSRLHDASRKTKGGYGLEALSSDKELADKLRDAFKERFGPGCVELLSETDTSANAKRGMKERFGLHKVKADGHGLVKAALVPPVHLLQLDEAFRHGWIDYSALDAKATWNVHYALKNLLQKDPAIMDEYLSRQLAAIPPPVDPSTPQEQAQAQLVADMQAALQTAVQAAVCARQCADRVEAAAAAANVKHNQVLAGSGKKKGGLPGPRGLAASKAKPPAASTAAAAAAATAAGQHAAVVEAGGRYTMWDLYRMYWRPFGDVLSAMESEGVRVNRDHLAAQEQQARIDQQEAQDYFRSWACRYVKGAHLMNVNSQTQIRQLLFPDQCPEPTKKFKAENPEYDPDSNARPKPRRWVDFELHGIWGAGQPGRLQPEVTTKKGSAAVSTAVLWSLVGKPGAAAKALAELDAAEAAAAAAAGGGEQQSAAADAAAAAAGSAAAGGGGVMSMVHEDGSPGELHLGDGDTGAAAAGTAGEGLEGDDQEGEEDGGAVRIVPGGQLSEVQLAALQAEAAEKKLGKMYAAMGGGREGLEACKALEKLIEVSLIEKLLTAFIQPLQQDNISTTHPRAEYERAAALAADSSSNNGASSSSSAPLLLGPTGEPASSSSSSSSGSSGSVLGPDWPEHIYRVHCSLNLNTETGRLSARRPNLQNQPALEKDRYKVRKAFCAEPGKALVVADYGQLELRLLAHMANCRSMITAFELGGDFHSRTALGMYDYIQDAIDRGECLLEWDGGPDHAPPPAPLLKDKFGSERRKAKILNFSIAYGKTAHGLSKDWGVSLAEAEETVKRWYADRPEVEQWQREQRAYAADKGFVNTMIGRRRGLRPAINASDKWLRARAERAAINTPIQGSAADVASAAMLSIVMDRELREMGWKLLLQVHDEVMLEGPEGSAESALSRVVACMENPWSNLMGLDSPPLRVQLAVDANIAGNWYEAK